VVLLHYLRIVQESNVSVLVQSEALIHMKAIDNFHIPLLLL